jgi:hypothetical protein
MGVPRCAVEIDNAGIERVFRIDGEGGNADELLEGAGSPERHAAGKALRALQLEADHPSLARRRRRKSERCQRGQRKALRIARPDALPSWDLANVMAVSSKHAGAHSRECAAGA